MIENQNTVDPEGTQERRAVDTGFLFDLSINHYEQRSREVLLKEGYNERQIELANRVLKHFGTSVGANLGQCKPELWSRQPCADCGAIVDTRECNSFPRYGKVLCEDDIRKRDEKRICIVCKGRYQDPAITDSLFALVSRHPIHKNNAYVCDWCAMTLVKGDTKFLTKRGASNDYHDHKLLIDQLRITTKRSSTFMTAEEHQDLANYVNRFEWYFDEQSGIDFGEQWKDYHLAYTGVVVGKTKELRQKVTTGPGWYIWHPNDETKIVWICRVRVFYKTSVSFIEILFKDRMKPSFDIRNANVIKTQQELLCVWKGRGLVYQIKGKTGTPFEYNDTNQFFEDAVRAYVTVFERKGEEHSSIPEIVEEMLIAKSTYYDTAARLGVLPRKIKQEAKRQYKAIREQHLSTKNR